MKRIVFCLIITCFFSACIKQNSKEVITKNEARILANKIIARGFDAPSPIFGQTDVYFLDKRGYLHKKDFNSITKWFEHWSQYKSLADYIYIVFNQKLGANDSVVIRSMGICCKADIEVLNLYQTKGFKGIIDKFNSYDSIHKCYRFRGVHTDSELETITYIFFINRYTKHESDIIYDIGLNPFPDNFENSW